MTFTKTIKTISCKGCGKQHALADQNSMGDSRCCHCGQWHNAVGQALIHPSEWGEDTGEVFRDDGTFSHERSW